MHKTEAYRNSNFPIQEPSIIFSGFFLPIGDDHCLALAQYVKIAKWAAGSFRPGRERRSLFCHFISQLSARFLRPLGQVLTQLRNRVSVSATRKGMLVKLGWHKGKRISARRVGSIWFLAAINNNDPKRCHRRTVLVIKWNTDVDVLVELAALADRIPYACVLCLRSTVTSR